MFLFTVKSCWWGSPCWPCSWIYKSLWSSISACGPQQHNRTTTLFPWCASHPTLLWSFCFCWFAGKATSHIKQGSLKLTKLNWPNIFLKVLRKIKVFLKSSENRGIFLFFLKRAIYPQISMAINFIHYIFFICCQVICSCAGARIQISPTHHQADLQHSATKANHDIDLLPYFFAYSTSMTAESVMALLSWLTLLRHNYKSYLLKKLVTLTWKYMLSILHSDYH